MIPTKHDLDFWKQISQLALSRGPLETIEIRAADLLQLMDIIQDQDDEIRELETELTEAANAG